jgi:uncharacterized ion transporter superfamily protein YfcC
VRANPEYSFVFDVPEARPPEPSSYPTLTRTHVAVLSATLAALVVIVWGIARFQWYFVELGALFAALAFVSAALGRISVDQTAKYFIEGASELTGTALMIGFARGIALVLEDGQVLHTIVHFLSSGLTHVGAAFSAVGMLLIQSAINFFIPSGSGQAYVTMPLMAPIADIVGVSRQVAVLAYQMGDGFTNAIVPTNAVLMGILGLAGIPFDRWFRFIAPLMVKILVAASISVVLAVWIGYS